MADNYYKAPVYTSDQYADLQQQSIDDREAELDRQRIARQQQLAQQQQQGGENLFSRWWTDDFSQLPVVGKPAELLGKGVEAGLTGLENLYEFVGDEYAYAASGLTGADLSREEASKYTAGQIVDARRQGIDITNSKQFQTNWGPTNINVLDQDFNVNWTSGLIDTTVAWFLDPLVLVGKGIKVARVGTNFGRAGRAVEAATGMEKGQFAIGGLTSTQSRVSQAAVTRTAERQVEQALAGESNRASVLADEIVAGDFTSLQGLYEFDGPYRDMLASVGSRIKNREDALKFLGASTGSAKYIQELQNTRPAMFMEMARSAAPNKYEEMRLAVGESGMPALLDTPLEAKVDVDKLVKEMRGQSKELDEAIAEFDALYMERFPGIESSLDLLESTFSPVQRWGMNSAKGAAVAAAWRAGKGKRLLGKDKRAAKRAAAQAEPHVIDDTPDLLPVEKTGTRPLMYEQVYSISSGLPKVRLWTWITGSRAAGMIDIRGYEVGNSSTELKAALSDSATIRYDQNFQAEMMNLWGSSLGAKDRYNAVTAIELQSFKHMFATKLAEKNAKKQQELQTAFNRGRISQETLDAELAKYPTTFTASQLPDLDILEQTYKIINEKRLDTIKKTRDGRAYLVDDNGDLVRIDPRLRSQLDTRVPMMDFRVLEETADILVKASDGMVDPARLARQTLSKQQAKARSAIVKGRVDTATSLWKASVLLRLGYTQRNVAEGWLRSMASIGIVPMLTRLPAWGINAPGNATRALRRRYSGKKLVAKENALIDEAVRQQRELTDYIKATKGVDDPDALAMQAQLDDITGRIERVRAKRKNLQVKKKADSSRTVGGRTYHAFAGEDEAIMRELTGMQQTQQNFFESAAMVEKDRALSSTSYGKLSPYTDQYWEELSQSVGQFRADPLSQQMLIGIANGETKRSVVAEANRWLKTRDGRRYRNEMKLRDIKKAEARVVELNDAIRRYLPTQQAMIVAAKGDDFGASVLRQAIEPYKSLDDLSMIHGREISDLMEIGRGGRTLRFLFKWLGSVPETTLVRQPYYASVWANEFDGLLAVAQSQYKGAPIPEKVLENINRTAKTRALRNMKDTLYTIERLSNPAATLRWFIPFFPAWENSVKTWTRMVADDPSIAVRASILWDIPNQLGMVVDEQGRPVPSDRMAFLTGSQNKYIRLPSGINQWLMDNVTGGVPVAIPQGAINVVTPGETPFLPGFGPMVTVPVAEFLRGKPETQALLRDNLPEAIYNQIAPFGQIPDRFDAFAPAWVRKTWQMLNGEDDAMYLGVADSMMKAEFVDWYEGGADPSQMPDVDDIMERTNQFYRFSILASLTAPFATTRTSKYQMQEDAWRQIVEIPSMTYRQKVDMFVEKYGTSFLPMTESTTKKVTPTLGNTIESYNVVTGNQALVQQISQQGDPRAVGVLTAGTQFGEFDNGVYKFWSQKNVFGTSEPFAERKTPAEMKTDALMTKAWAEFRQMKDWRDEALAARGVTLTANAAKDIKAQWDNFVKVEMRDKYGMTWVTNYNEYTDLTPSYIAAIDSALNDPGFMSGQGDSDLWDQIGEYMSMRNYAIEAINAGYDAKTVREQFEVWATDYKYSSLEFSDFFDNFLENDDLGVRTE